MLDASRPGGEAADQALAAARTVIRHIDLATTEASAAYSTPIVMNGSTVVRAKVFDAGLQPGATVSQNYTLLGSDVVNFSSNLPLIIINTFGRSIPDGTKIRANARFIETMGGRAWLTGAPDYDGVAKRVMRGDIYEEAMKEIGYAHGGQNNEPETLFDGVAFDRTKPEEYAKSFPINNLKG